MIDRLLFEGDIFGIVDNGILAVITIFGIDLEKKFFGGSGVLGGLFGALIGNAISDFLAAVVDPSARHLAIGVFAGCMYVAALTFILLKLFKKKV